MTSRVGRLPELFVAASLLHLAATLLSGFLPQLLILRTILGFFLISYALGASVRTFAKRRGVGGLPETGGVGGAALDVCLSIALNVLLSYLLLSVFQFGALQLAALIDGVIIALNAPELLYASGGERLGADSWRGAAHGLVAPLVLLLASVYFGLYFRGWTPYPSLSGWDINNVLAYANMLTERGGFSYLLIPSWPLAGTPYSAAFFFTVASYGVFTGLRPEATLWLGVIPLTFLYMLLVYYVALKLSGSAVFSLASAFAAFYASVFLAEVVRNPLYPTPDMLAQLVFLLMLVYNMYDRSSGRGRLAVNLLLAFFILLFNYFTAFIVSPFLAYFIFEGTKFPVIRDGKTALRLCVFGVILLVFFAPLMGGVLGATFQPFYTASPFSQLQKALSLLVIYSPLFIILCAAGAAAGVLIRRHDARGGLGYPDFTLYAAMGLILYFSPAWITYRVEFYFRDILAVFIAGLAVGFERLRFTRSEIKLGNHGVKMGAVIGLLVLASIVASMQPTFAGYTPSSYYSKDEYDVAQWLRENTPKGSYIVTDTSSGYLFRGLAVRNASSYFILPDGRMPADYSTIAPNIVADTHDFLANQTATWHSPPGIAAVNTYVLVTSRTVIWASVPKEAVITHPIDGLDYTQMREHFTEPDYTKVYESPTCIIYRMNRGG